MSVPKDPVFVYVEGGSNKVYARWHNARQHQEDSSIAPTFKLCDSNKQPLGRNQVFTAADLMLRAGYKPVATASWVQQVRTLEAVGTLPAGHTFLELQEYLAKSILPVSTPVPATIPLPAQAAVVDHSAQQPAAEVPQPAANNDIQACGPAASQSNTVQATDTATPGDEVNVETAGHGGEALAIQAKKRIFTQVAPDDEADEQTQTPVKRKKKRTDDDTTSESSTTSEDSSPGAGLAIDDDEASITWPVLPHPHLQQMEAAPDAAMQQQMLHHVKEVVRALRLAPVNAKWCLKMLEEQYKRAYKNDDYGAWEFGLDYSQLRHMVMIGVRSKVMNVLRQQFNLPL